MGQLIIKYCLPALLIFFVSCFEEDERVEPWPGEVFTISEDVEKNFSYFDLETGLVVSSHQSNEWQLGFDCRDTAWTIQLNSGDNWFIWNSEEADINAPIRPSENELWKYDIQWAFPDSTAIGAWVKTGSTKNVYTEHVYFLGHYQQGNYVNIIRLQFIHVDDIKYKFLRMHEEVGTIDTVTILKETNKSFTYYDFSAEIQRDLEPARNTFDIIFCPYFDLVTQLGLTIPYLVRGSLLNSFETFAILDTINDYDRIDYEMLPEYDFTAQRDIIGYNWKDVAINPGLGTATYTVKPNYVYIVKTSSGRHFKIRFLSFSIDGISGFPRFEYKELKSSE